MCPAVPMMSGMLGGCPGSHGGCGERSGGARRQPRCQMAARSSLLRRPPPGARPAHRTASVVAALAALAPRLVHHYPDGLLNLRSLGHPDRTAPAVAAQEDVERARTAVAGAGGGEAEHDARRAPAREPRLEPLLQHRRLVLRVVAAAVHDEHAAMPEHDRLPEEAG